MASRCHTLGRLEASLPMRLGFVIIVCLSLYHFPSLFPFSCFSGVWPFTLLSAQHPFSPTPLCRVSVPPPPPPPTSSIAYTLWHIHHCLWPAIHLLHNSSIHCAHVQMPVDEVACEYWLFNCTVCMWSSRVLHVAVMILFVVANVITNMVVSEGVKRSQSWI